MSTTTDESIATPRPVETAPSMMVAEAATTSRIVGTAGLFFLVLGAFAVGAHRIFTTPRMIGEGYGFIAVVLGLVLMLYHAARDTEPEMRRLYGVFAFAVLILAIVAGIVPGPVFSKVDAPATGYNLAWSIPFAFVSLAFLTVFIRNETEEGLRSIARLTLLAVGAVATIGIVIGGAYYPNFFAGPGVGIAVIGLAYFGAFFATTETSEGLGYQAGIALGVLGLLVFYGAMARTMFPAVLVEGPQGLKKPNGAFDAWKVVARILGALAFLVPAVFAYLRQGPRWLTGLLAILVLVGVGVLAVGSFRADAAMVKDPFLVPGGLALMAIGIVSMAIALGVCSDSQFVALTRRELGSYFTSPIGYLVLLGMAVVGWFGYRDFLRSMIQDMSLTAGGEVVIPEPIVRFYFVNIQPVFVVLLLVPALTMRLLAEEKRSGSLEVLLTAPVSESTVVLSKFTATWIFFLISWIPAGLFLITLRVENGEAFDYRPLLSFYLALAACGAGFVAMGLFFSSLSPNQIVAAVLTFVGMAFFLLCFFEKQAFGLGKTVEVVMERFSFVNLWQESLKGQLPLKDVIAWLSFAGFWLFTSVKVLEARRWQ